MINLCHYDKLQTSLLTPLIQKHHINPQRISFESLSFGKSAASKSSSQSSAATSQGQNQLQRLKPWSCFFSSMISLSCSIEPLHFASYENVIFPTTTKNWEEITKHQTDSKPPTPKLAPSHWLDLALLVSVFFYPLAWLSEDNISSSSASLQPKLPVAPHGSWWLTSRPFHRIRQRTDSEWVALQRSSSNMDPRGGRVKVSLVVQQRPRRRRCHASCAGSRLSKVKCLGGLKSFGVRHKAFVVSFFLFIRFVPYTKHWDKTIMLILHPPFARANS